jgi:lysylphosphatidylglycerol synthetase-like protein (DUF2156 family)
MPAIWWIDPARVMIVNPISLQNTRSLRILRLSQILLIGNAAIWILAGGAGLFRLESIQSVPIVVLILLAIGMIGYGLVLIVCAIGLNRKPRVFYILSLTLVSLSVVLPIFDDFGWADFLAMLPALVTLIYLLVFRKALSSGNQSVG